MITIPFLTSESAESFKRSIGIAAIENGITDFQAAIIISHFFEAVSDELAKNHVVVIPSIGAFGARTWKPRHDPKAPAYCYPAFIPSRAYRDEVCIRCPKNGAALTAIDKHRINCAHRKNSGKNDRQPASTHRAFRERVRAQSRRIGWEVRG